MASTLDVLPSAAQPDLGGRWDPALLSSDDRVNYRQAVELYGSRRNQQDLEMLAHLRAQISPSEFLVLADARKHKESCKDAWDAEREVFRNRNANTFSNDVDCYRKGGAQHDPTYGGWLSRAQRFGRSPLLQMNRAAMYIDACYGTDRADLKLQALHLDLQKDGHALRAKFNSEKARNKGIYDVELTGDNMSWTNLFTDEVRLDPPTDDELANVHAYIDAVEDRMDTKNDLEHKVPYASKVREYFVEEDADVTDSPWTDYVDITAASIIGLMDRKGSSIKEQRKWIEAKTGTYNKCRHLWALKHRKRFTECNGRYKLAMPGKVNQKKKKKANKGQQDKENAVVQTPQADPEMQSATKERANSMRPTNLALRENFAQQKSSGKSKARDVGTHGYMNVRKAGLPSKARTGSGAMEAIPGSKRAMEKDAEQRNRKAPTHRQERDKGGFVPYRTDAIRINSIGRRACVFEALRFATGMLLTHKDMGLESMNDVNVKQLVHKIDMTPALGVRLQKESSCPWSKLLAKKPGIYMFRVNLKDGETHYMVIDTWRMMLFSGGAPPAPAKDPVDQHLLVDMSDEDDANDELGRLFYVTDDEVKNPALFEQWVMTNFNVRGKGVDTVYRVMLRTKHARSTCYNTPEDYE